MIGKRRERRRRERRERRERDRNSDSDRCQYLLGKQKKASHHLLAKFKSDSILHCFDCFYCFFAFTVRARDVRIIHGTYCLICHTRPLTIFVFPTRNCMILRGNIIAGDAYRCWSAIRIYYQHFFLFQHLFSSFLFSHISLIFYLQFHRIVEPHTFSIFTFLSIFVHNVYLYN